MRLMVDPSAEPVAHHTLILVPLHWQDDVKAGLDQDVSLGVLEPVTVRKACHMVPQHGHLCKKEQQAPTHSRLAGA